MDPPGWPAGLPRIPDSNGLWTETLHICIIHMKTSLFTKCVEISKTGHDMQVVFSQSYELFIWGKICKKRHKRTLNWTLNCVVVKGFEHCHFDTRSLQNSEVLVLGLEVWRWSRVHLCEEHNSIWKEVQFDSHPSFHPWEKGVMD
jgi:hypothetical protein